MRFDTLWEKKSDERSLLKLRYWGNTKQCGLEDFKIYKNFQINIKSVFYY